VFGKGPSLVRELAFRAGAFPRRRFFCWPAPEESSRKEWRGELTARATVAFEELTAALRAEAEDGRISCAAALSLARRLGVNPAAVGRACDELGLKIVSCQLGCFGRGSKGT